MRQIGELGGPDALDGNQGAPADEAAFAFCLGEVAISIELRDGRRLWGQLVRLSYLDHRRDRGSVTLCGPSGRVEIGLDDVASIGVPERW
jgi:hypothetical protein